MLVYPKATLRIQTWEQGSTILRSLVQQSYRSIAVFVETRLLHAVLVWFVDPVFVLFSSQQPIHLIHLIVFDLDVAKQTSILRHYSVGNRGWGGGGGGNDHISQVFLEKCRGLAVLVGTAG